MRYKKLRGLIVVVIVLILLLITTYCMHKALKAPETMTAQISIPLEDLSANTYGTVTAIFVKDYDIVKAGDTIAELSRDVKRNCQPSGEKSQKAAAEYENAAIMYKDGIITQAEYDASLSKYRAYKSGELCTKFQTKKENIISPVSGKIENIEIKEGAEVTSETLVGKIQTGEAEIIAYFSPKDKKKLRPGRPVRVQIIKYPEKEFTGFMKEFGAASWQGIAVKIRVNEDISSLNLRNGDAAMILAP